ncbi:hypothetical protein RB195_007667 [Necator americanus]|uniref:Reverse transcriptase domain-containing protein n=1 Tax=Necator americanus TaxID=51031 RepID=A0ABR1C0Z5_NECAM
MRGLKWNDMGVKVDGRHLQQLRFADDIFLIKLSINQAERMLAEFDETCKKIALQLNLRKTMLMHNKWVSDVPFTLNGTKLSECTSYFHLCRELNMMNNLIPELGRRRRAAWGAYKSIENAVKKTTNTWLRARLFNTTVLPALTYASETWAFLKQEENAISVIERGVETMMLGVTRFTPAKEGIRSSFLRHRSKIRDGAAYAKESKTIWAGHVMRFNDNRWTRAVGDGYHATSNVSQEDRRSSSRSSSKKSTTLFEFFARRDATEQQLSAIGRMELLLVPARAIR